MPLRPPRCPPVPHPCHRRPAALAHRALCHLPVSPRPWAPGGRSAPPPAAQGRGLEVPVIPPGWGLASPGASPRPPPQELVTLTVPGVLGELGAHVSAGRWPGPGAALLESSCPAHEMLLCVPQPAVSLPASARLRGRAERGVGVRQQHPPAPAWGPASAFRPTPALGAFCTPLWVSLSHFRVAWGTRWANSWRGPALGGTGWPGNKASDRPAGPGSAHGTSSEAGSRQLGCLCRPREDAGPPGLSCGVPHGRGPFLSSAGSGLCGAPTGGVMGTTPGPPARAGAGDRAQPGGGRGTDTGTTPGTSSSWTGTWALLE